MQSINIDELKNFMANEHNTGINDLYGQAGTDEGAASDSAPPPEYEETAGYSGFDDDGAEQAKRPHSNGVPDWRPLFNRLRGRGFAEKSEMARQRGKGIKTSIELFIPKNLGEVSSDKYYAKSGEPLTFKGLTIIAARTSGGKTTNLISLLNYLLVVTNEERAAQRAEYLAANGGAMADYQEKETRPIYGVVIGLEEPSDAVYAQALSGFIEYARDDWRKKHNPHGAEESPVYISTIESYMRGEPIEAAYKASIDRYAPMFDKSACVIGQEDIRLEAIKMGDETPIDEPLPLINQLIAIKEMIPIYKAALESEGLQPVFFLDYAQRVHSEKDEQSIYKGIQAVMETLTECVANGAVIFSAAQMNREGVKQFRTDNRREIYEVIAEYMREGADIEQAAELILYSLIDDSSGTPSIWLRTLKYRGGVRYQFAEIPVLEWRTKTARYDKVRPLPFTPNSGKEKAEKEPPKGKAGRGASKASRIL